MSVSSLRVIAVLASALALAACSSGRPEPLPAAPARPVQSAALQPMAPLEAEEAAAEAPQAALPAESTALEIGRTDLLGGWAVSSGGETCQLFMSLTEWSGGYRASTRGCSGPTLARIAAWDLTGKQIQLKADDGSSVATLLAVDQTRFNGATSDGAAITVQR